ncbi:MAG: hypothetical protein Tsb0010_18190 [Parvularculaceae bacterium]
MQRKLPVFQTVGESLTFGLFHIFTVLRLAWLPMVLTFVVWFAALVLVFGSGIMAVLTAGVAEGFAGKDVLEQIIEGMAWETVGLGFGAVAILAYLTAALVTALLAGSYSVPIFRLAAIGDAPPRGIFNLRIGPPQWRYLAATVIQIVLILIPVAAIVAGAFTLAALAGDGFGPLFNEILNDGESYSEVTGPAGWGIAAIAIIGVIFVIWLVLRLFTFLPATAAEDRIALGSAFSMTGGNVWRLLGAAIIYGIALALISFALEMALAITALIGGALTVAIVAAFAGGGAGAAGAILGPLGVILITALYILYFAYSLGVQLAFPAVAYKYLHRDG